MFNTNNKLEFKVSSNSEHGKPFVWKVGTVVGTAIVTGSDIVVLTAINLEPENGHHIDAMQWFLQIQIEGRRRLLLRDFSEKAYTITRLELEQYGFTHNQFTNTFIKEYKKRNGKAKIVHHN